MRWMKITILTVLTLMITLAAEADADTLRQDSNDAGDRLISAEAASSFFEVWDVYPLGTVE